MVVAASGRAVSEPRVTFLGQGGASSGAKALAASPSAPPLTMPGTGLQAILGYVSAVRWYCELGACGSGQCGSATLAENPGRSRLGTAVVSHSLGWRRAQVCPAKSCGMDGWRWARCRSLVQGHRGTGIAKAQRGEAKARLFVGVWVAGRSRVIPGSVVPWCVHARCWCAPSSSAMCSGSYRESWCSSRPHTVIFSADSLPHSAPKAALILITSGNP